MSISIQDFFKPIHFTGSPASADYKRIQSFVRLATTFSHLTYQTIYLIDYYKQGFHYVSENPLFLCGKSAKQVLDAGYSFYLNNVPDEDLQLLLKVNDAGFNFYNKIPVEERLNYSISYDFRLKQPNGHLNLINHKLAPLVLDKDGGIWIALCIISFSSNDKPGNIVITKNGDEKKMFEYALNTKKWNESKKVKLNYQEKEILMLSIQGFTVKEIGQRLYLSSDTIKFHKKNIFKKFNATNIPAAIFAAVNQGII